MIRRLSITALIAITLAGSATAAVREVSQAELRRVVNAGQAKGLGQVLSNVAKRVKGETVDVRVFDADGLIYSILVMLPNGKMGTVFVDAVSGDFVAPNSNRARVVKTATQKARGANGNAKAATKSKGKSKSSSKKSSSKNKGKGSSSKSKRKK